MTSPLFKLFLAAIMTVSFSSSAFAKAQEMDPNWKAYNEFFKKTGVTQKEVKLKDFLEIVKGQFPEKMYQELQEVLKEYPDLTMPKFAVSKVKDKSNIERLQLQYTKDGQSGTFMIIDQGENFAKSGPNFITTKDLMSLEKTTMKLIKSAKGERVPASVKPAEFYLLKANEIAKLPKAEQEKYVRGLRSLLAGIESFDQVKFLKKGKSKTHKKTVWNQYFLQEAQALSGGASCSIGGNYKVSMPDNWSDRLSCAWSATDKGNCVYCGRDQPEVHTGCKNTSTEVRCNPLIYGDRVSCVDATLSKNVAEDCNKMTENDPMAAFQDSNHEARFKDKDSFDRLMSNVLVELRAAQAVCAEYANRHTADGHFDDDEKKQEKECKSLKERQDQIYNTSYCSEAFKKALPEVSKLQCQGRSEEEGAGSPDREHAGTDGEINPDQKVNGDTGTCSRLTKLPDHHLVFVDSKNNLECRDQTIASNSCVDENGQTRMAYNCLNENLPDPKESSKGGIGHWFMKNLKNIAIGVTAGAVILGIWLSSRPPKHTGPAVQPGPSTPAPAAPAYTPSLPAPRPGKPTGVDQL